MIVVWLIVGVLVVCFGLIVLRGAPYVPTHRRQLEVAFGRLYRLKESDVVADLGSGDGVVLLAAVRRGAGALGYELNPLLAWLSRWRLRRYERARVAVRDFMLLERLPADVTVVYAFTTGHSIEAIGRKLEGWSRHQKLYFISYGFALGGRAPLRSSGPMHLYVFG